MKSFTKMASRIFAEIEATVHRPSRIWKIFDAASIQRFLQYHRVAKKADGNWNAVHESGIANKTYRNYADYSAVQTSKLGFLDLDAHEARFRTALSDRICDLEFVGSNCSVICLGARLGAEVKAFLDAGCFAVGIDLNPGPNNKYVLYGDFHDLQMADSSVDIVYSNSIDHAFALDRMVDEIKRVLRPGGHIILEPDPGIEDPGGIAPDLWAAQSWKKIDDLVEFLKKQGLRLQSRRPFEYPRNGEQLILRPDHSESA